MSLDSRIVTIDESWRTHLAAELTAPYMGAIFSKLDDEHRAGKSIFPTPMDWFTALRLTPFATVKVVVLGQDPYHRPDQAHGLSFSVKPGVKHPPSLRNIFKELEQDLAIPPAQHGCLTSWAKQGVLLLNSVLTVVEGCPGAHAKLGWERFTDQIITILNRERQGLVFILWGAYAQKKGALIDERRHLLVRSAHPSPLSAHRGFFGSRPFSRVNDYLESTGQTPIQWRLPEIPLNKDL